MVTVEEARRAQRFGARAMMDPRFGLLSDRKLFEGAAQVIMAAGALLSAPVYTWARPIKRLVDQAAASYPVADAIEALHFFHQPVMFWIFDEPILTVQNADDGKDSAIDAVLILPFRHQPGGNVEDGNRQWAKRFLAAAGGDALALEQHATDVLTNSNGVMVVAMSSLRTGAGIDFTEWRQEHFARGSRLPVPLLTKSLLFGQRPDAHGLSADQLQDPMIVPEFTALTRWVLAACALLKQRILRVVEGHGTRAECKRLLKDDLRTDAQSIVLRAAEHEPPTGQRLIEWACRWIVSGHWHKQWYPSDREHRVIWIPPYIKGPEDKALVVREKVFAVSR